MKTSAKIDPAQIARALSDPARTRILKMISAHSSRVHSHCADGSPGPVKGICVCDLRDSLGMIQSRVSYHIKELKAAGLIEEETHGKWSYYRIRQSALKAYLASIKSEFKV